ncbi:hypothetical protein NSTC745_03006 [Nostoc sp. DSM 114161]|jgi:hypothetical protein|uniref:hypothetical protein n=1 Tax=Nostoc sp. DSM 114161 TaxID=3440143 RepID=UPI004045F711
MGVDGFWWFYKVEKPHFSIIQSKFTQAASDAPSLPEVPSLAPRQQAPPVTQEYINSVLEGVLAGRYLSSAMYHKPFESIAYQIVKDEFPLSLDSCVGMVMQSRTLPTAILLIGIGSDRFSQLPGCLGNMLIHPDEIEQTLASVSQILTVDWESYFKRAKLILDYAGFDDDAARDVLEVLQALPRALQEVKSQGAGLLAITSLGCP